MVRHERAKQRNQQMAEKHKQMIETMQGVISLVVASGRLKGQEHTQPAVRLFRRTCEVCTLRQYTLERSLSSEQAECPEKV